MLFLQDNINRASLVLSSLKLLYPTTKAHLLAANPWELLVATILSAQCTDERVNKVTPELFRLWKTPQAMAQASVADIEICIHSLGFFHNKAKNIHACAKILAEKFNSEVPADFNALVKLPGVGRKTASVVLWNAYGLNEGIAIDTHVARISLRLGLTSSTDPKKAEQELMKILDQSEWGNYNHRLVSFGRELCSARSAQCNICPMASFCPKIGVQGK